MSGVACCLAGARVPLTHCERERERASARARSSVYGKPNGSSCEESAASGHSLYVVELQALHSTTASCFTSLDTIGTPPKLKPECPSSIEVPARDQSEGGGNDASGQLATEDMMLDHVLHRQLQAQTLARGMGTPGLPGAASFLEEFPQLGMSEGYRVSPTAAGSGAIRAQSLSPHVLVGQSATSSAAQSSEGLAIRARTLSPPSVLPMRQRGGDFDTSAGRKGYSNPFSAVLQFLV